MKASIVIPVLNEEIQLAANVEAVRGFLDARCPFDYEIIIANNGSSDGTQAIAERLSKACPKVRALSLPARGRGGALRRAWLESEADILCYMDVDLATDLAALPPLVAALASGQFDLAIGSRLAPGSRTGRGWKREFISRCYARLVRYFFPVGFSDAQCGFKAITSGAARELLPLVEDNGWFFDTELLVLADRFGYRIAELPVIWNDDADSRVRILSTAWADLCGLVRLRHALSRGFVRSPRCGMGQNSAVQGAG